jgi:MFS family permease
MMPGLAVGFVNVHYPVVTGFLILHLARYGNSGPAAFTAYAGAMLCSRFFLGGLPDRVHPRVTFYFGLTSMAVTGLLVLAAGPRPAIAICGAAMLGLGFSFPFSSIASTVMRRSPDHERGSTVGTLSAFYDLFVGAGSFAAGAVATRSSATPRHS